jgi:hypothetical protein
MNRVNDRKERFARVFGRMILFRSAATQECF